MRDLNESDVVIHVEHKTRIKDYESSAEVVIKENDSILLSVDKERRERIFQTVTKQVFQDSWFILFWFIPNLEVEHPIQALAVYDLLIIDVLTTELR